MKLSGGPAPRIITPFVMLLMSALVCLAPACSREGRTGQYDGIIELDQRLLGFEVGGRMTKIYVREGDAVTEGQTLARLDDALERSQRPVLEADVARADARLRLLIAGPRESEIATVAEQLTAANTQVEAAERELRRQRPLLETGSIAQAMIDDLETRAREARARRDSVTQQLKTLKQGSRAEEILAAKAERDAAAARLAALDEQLAHYELKSPTAGRVIDRMALEGEVVSPGTPVVLFAEPARPYVDLFVPVPELSGIKLDQKASVLPDGDRNSYEGKVEYISATTEYTPRYLLNEKDRSALVTRVRVRIQDPGEHLHAGVPCKATLGPVPATAAAGNE